MKINMHLKHKIIFYRLIIIVVSIWFVNNIAFSDLNRTQSTLLKSASELDYPPFSIVRPDGNADGFSVDLLKAVVKETNLQVKIYVGPWHEIKQQLTKGTLDVLPLVAYSEERDKIYDFTVPYLEMHGTIFVRKGEKSIQSEADLRDKEVLVMRDDASHEYAVRENVSEKLILTETFEVAMKLLSAGKHDAIMCQYLVGQQLIKKLDISNVVSITTELDASMKPTGKPVSGFGQKFCIAVKEGDKELLARLNEGLAIVVAKGTYDKLYLKWFKPILPQPTVPLITIIKSALFILAPIILLVAVVGIWYLRREVRRKT